jgi:hypothetical protein
VEKNDDRNQGPLEDWTIDRGEGFPAAGLDFTGGRNVGFIKLSG